MAYIGFARTNFGPYETYERILEELRKRDLTLRFLSIIGWGMLRLV
ncbi:hypothetical protein [Thermococcus sp.]